MSISTKRPISPGSIPYHIGFNTDPARLRPLPSLGYLMETPTFQEDIRDQVDSKCKKAYQKACIDDHRENLYSPSSPPRFIVGKDLLRVIAEPKKGSIRSIEEPFKLLSLESRYHQRPLERKENQPEVQYERGAARELQSLKVARREQVSDSFIEKFSLYFLKAYQKFEAPSGCRCKKKLVRIYRGSSCDIFKVKFKGQSYAVKVILQNIDAYSRQRERVLLATIPHHPNLVNTLFSMELQLGPKNLNGLAHIMPLVDGTSLEKKETLTSPLKIDANIMARALTGEMLALDHLELHFENYQHLIRDIVHALFHLQTHGLIHGAVVPSNILAERCKERRTGFFYKLTDFGLTRSCETRSGLLKSEDRKVAAHTRLFPEPLANNNEDIQQFGISLAQLLLGHPLRKPCPELEWLEGDFPLLTDLIYRCTKAKRELHMEEILEHPFLKARPRTLALTYISSTLSR